MARPVGIMTRSSDPDSLPNPEIIDRLLRQIRSLAPPSDQEVADDRLPAKQNIYKLAESFGLRVRRGSGGDESVVPIPEYYSEREARLVVARNVARVGIDRVKNQCHVDGRSPSPANDVCKLVNARELNRGTLDSIAAAILMPTEDFMRWAQKLRRNEELLADSYAVPIELARFRLEALELFTETAN
jgi:hypothetical protein